MPSVPQSMPSEPEYVWEIATCFPAQGDWTESEYLAFTEGAERRFEFTDGHLEPLTMPTRNHEYLVQYLYFALYQFVTTSGLGAVFNNGMRLRTRLGKYRLPDVLYLSKERMHLETRHGWHGADLTMEVVSDDPRDRERDYEKKLVDYAEAAIREYWIVDPKTRTVQVHKLDGNKYALHGEFSEGETATSVLLSGFKVDVRALFAVMKDLPE